MMATAAANQNRKNFNPEEDRKRRRRKKNIWWDWDTILCMWIDWCSSTAEWGSEPAKISNSMKQNYRKTSRHLLWSHIQKQNFSTMQVILACKEKFIPPYATISTSRDACNACSIVRVTKKPPNFSWKNEQLQNTLKKFEHRKSIVG